MHMTSDPAMEKMQVLIRHAVLSVSSCMGYCARPGAGLRLFSADHGREHVHLCARALGRQALREEEQAQGLQQLPVHGQQQHDRAAAPAHPATLF